MFAAVVLAATPAGAQSGPHLVITSPVNGDIYDGTPPLVVQARGVPAGTRVGFDVMVDGKSLGSSASVVAGSTATVSLGNLPVGAHTVSVNSSGSDAAGDSATFDVRRSGFSGIGLLIVAALVGLMVFYRRRLLEPFSRRYERPANGPGEPRDGDSTG